MAEKAEIKEHIAAMKIKRDDAIARKATDELKQIRRSIRTLKRRIRTLAKAAKLQTAQTEAAVKTDVATPDAAEAGAPAEAAEETPQQE